jgi:hypothetical protein
LAAGKCAHAACGTNYFVDADSAASCDVGSACSARISLVAVGEYHINDDYPYKFVADSTAGVAFRGTDAAGPNVFSKAANNWSRHDEKTGTMAVTFSPTERGSKQIGGVFKFSVCSAQNCQLEHIPVSVTVAVR